MDIFLDYLLDINVTDLHSMNSSNTKQHDNFSRQISTFEKLLMLTQSKFNIDKSHHFLKLVLRDGAKNRGALKINSINSLQEAIDSYCSIVHSDEDRDSLRTYFQSYFAQVELMKRLKGFYHKTIYHALYEYFYNPLDELSEDEHDAAEEDVDSDDDGDGGDKSDKSDVECKPISSPVPYDEPTRPNKTSQSQLDVPKKKSKKRSRERDKNGESKGKKKKKKRKDNRLKVLERIQKEKEQREALLANQKFEEPALGVALAQIKDKTDRQKLAFAVRSTFTIYNSWESLFQPGVIPLASFDSDSSHLLREVKNYAPYEPILRLLPDMLVKGYKLVDLAKIWYNCSRRLIGLRQVVYKTIGDFFYEMEAKDRLCEQIDEETKEKSEQRLTKISERKMITNKILRSEKIKHDYEESVEKERELKDYYKQLKSERNAEYPRLEKLQRDDLQYRKIYENIQKLADAMSSTYRELQTTSYEMAMLKQDYKIEMEARSNLIRLKNDVTSAINDIEMSLPINQQRKVECKQHVKIMRDNLERMWLVLYYSTADVHLTRKADNIFNIKFPINKSNNPSPTMKPNTAEIREQHVMEAAIDSQLKQDESHIKSKHSSHFSPSSAGITDPVEAEDYRARVERLKKEFSLDLSELKTTINIELHSDQVSPPRTQYLASPILRNELSPPRLATGDETTSGDDADQESDDSSPRPTSKKLTRKFDTIKLSSRSDPSHDSKKVKMNWEPKKPVPPRSPKTVYILKRSKPKPPPKIQYLHKIHSPIHLPKLSDEVYKQIVPQTLRPDRDNLRPNHQEILRLDRDSANFIDTLSMYKKSPMPGFRPSLTPVQGFEQAQGVFTSLRDFSDGDISIDSGTGNSLSEDDSPPRKQTPTPSKPTQPPKRSRIPKRSPKIAFSSPTKDDIVATTNTRIPHFNPKRKHQQKPKLKPRNDDFVFETPSPVSPLPTTRHTLAMNKPEFIKPPKRLLKPEKPAPPHKLPPPRNNKLAKQRLSHQPNRPSNSHPLNIHSHKLPNQVSPTTRHFINKRKPREAPVPPLYRKSRPYDMIDGSDSDEGPEIFKQSIGKPLIQSRPMIKPVVSKTLNAGIKRKNIATRPRVY